MAVVCLALAASSQVATSQTSALAPVRPGPDILYEAPATSPQLENKGVWKAAPILISGVSAYRNGEFLYQDYLYDDRGAGQRALYPPDRAKYADNAADFVEVRVKPLAADTAFRLSFNSMLDFSLVGATIALGDGVQAAVIPFGAGGKEPATIFVTVHGSTAVITDAATGQEVSTRAAVTVDPAARQVEVRVPYTAFDPRKKTAVRIAAATGVWDPDKNAYRTPGDPPAPPPPEPGAAPARGGRGGRGLPPLNPARSLFFNVAYRYHEPLNTGSLLPFFSDVQQAEVLMSGDLSPFYASVDFVKLASGRDDNSQVPAKGFMSRILVSHFEPAQGRGTATNLGKSCAQPCIPQFAGRLQPYEIYVPAKTPPASGYGLTIDLHSADASYARWLGNARHVEFGERGTGSIVITPNGRGLRSGYLAESAADPFEVWADVARHYKIDNDYVSLAGVSMGAMGSFKFAGQFPDLFAAMAVSVGCPSDPIMVGHREVPAFIHTGDVDTTTNCHPGNKVLEKYLTLNQQYTWWNFLEHPHPFSSRPKSWQPFADYLGMKKRAADPPHVTFAYNADLNEPRFGINSDHAYWISHVAIRDMSHKLQANPPVGANPPANAASASNGPAYGIIDVVSYGMGRGDRVVNPVETGKGVYKFGTDDYPWPNYNSREETWGAAPTTPVRNVLDVKAENIASVTIDPKRAKVTCGATVNVASDGPIEVHLVGCSNVKTVANQ